MSAGALILLVLFGAAVVVGGVIAFVAARKAPNGFEDEEGFHPTNRSKKKWRERNTPAERP